MTASAPGHEPEMSVVLAAARNSKIQRTLAHLRNQSARRDLELVVVTDAPDPEGLIDAETREAFGSHQVVRVPAIQSKGAANAEGFRRARAPVVAFAEDHCFAEPGWAEALIRRHRLGCAAAAPRIRNANPATALSWCDLLINYGPWLENSPKTMDTLPGQNCSYNRKVLQAYDDRLPDWLDVENELHLKMAALGLQLHFEPDAVVAHVNLSRWRSWLRSLFHAGRLYAAERCSTWSGVRKMAYASTWPAIAGARWFRVVANWPEDVAGLPSAWRLAPTLLLGLLWDAAGQGAGYLTGAGDAGRRMLGFEFGRAAHVRADERWLLEGNS